METNEVLDKLPGYLMDLVIDQPYNEYTAQDHAVWRFVMRQNTRYLPRVAHGSYLAGLTKTGISIDEIPHMYGMNRILKEIGWAAVAVDGFIPPAAFMEFQAHNVLVIAADIRPIGQIGYTPAPDIIHEAAGHAPIIADPEYAHYLKRFGEVGAKAFSSRVDYQLYEAIRHLSILKANPYSSKESIRNAEKKMKETESLDETSSEMSGLRNLHWWTVEYGLIGDIQKPKIYGAGLLSSISESFNCLENSVQKIPYTLDAALHDFDITTQQPQLFVTPDFETLHKVLDEFTETLGWKRGGMYGIRKAIESENLATCELSSGIQISGTFYDVFEEGGLPVYIRSMGPTHLCFRGQELNEHGTGYHKDGFGTPVGKLKNATKPLENFGETDLKKQDILKGRRTILEFESGIKVNGVVKEILQKEEKIILITFYDCLVKYKDKILFLPEWGPYDMAVGEKIVSVFSGSADPEAYGFRFPEIRDRTQKIVHTNKARELHELYQEIRDIREGRTKHTYVDRIWEKIRRDYPEDWLLPLEMLELLKNNRQEAAGNEIRFHLEQFKKHPEYEKLIEDGFALL